MTRERLLKELCPTNCVKQNVCEYCGCEDICYIELNKFLDEYEESIRTEVLNELKSQKDEIIKWLIKRNLEGYGTTNGELLDHIFDLAEKLKEQNNK